MQPYNSAEFIPLTDYWPLSRERPLPAPFFGPEYLEKVFFRALPQLLRCPATAVRKALKVLLKRTAREVYRELPNESDMTVRDRALAAAACNEPRARERITELSVTDEVMFSRFGRQRIKYRERTVNIPLPKLLWLGYRTDPDYKLFVEWIKNVGIERPDIGEGYYLTGHSIEKVLSDGLAPPLLLDSIDFARTIIIFGGLLPAAEALDLFTTASRLGCRPLQAMLELGTSAKQDPSPPGLAPTDIVAPDTLAIAALDPRPRLVRPDPAALVHGSIVRSTPELEKMVTHLLNTQAGWREAERLTNNILIPGVGVILANEDYQRAIDLINAARDARHMALNAQQACRQKSHELITQAYRKTGLEPPDMETNVGDGESVASQLRAADELWQLASHYDASIRELVAWRNALEAAPTRDDFERLSALRLLSDANQHACHQFRDNVIAFLSQSRSAAEVSEWIRELNPMEIACIVESLNEAPWVVPAAILVRIGLDRGAEAFAPYLASALIAAPNLSSRRSLMRFCDPSSAALDREPTARRIVAAERLRDILQPIPQRGSRRPSCIH